MKAFPPVTEAVRRVEGCVKYQSEKAGGRASCTSNITYGPAGWKALDNMIHMCYILSDPLPQLKHEGKECVCLSVMWMWGQLQKNSPNLMIFPTWLLEFVFGVYRYYYICCLKEKKNVVSCFFIWDVGPEVTAINEWLTLKAKVFVRVYEEWVFCKWQPTRQQKGAFECLCRARLFVIIYTLSLITSPGVTGWPCCTWADMLELLTTSLRENSSFDFKSTLSLQLNQREFIMQP